MNILRNNLARPFSLIFCNQFCDQQFVYYRGADLLAPANVRCVSLLICHAAILFLCDHDRLPFLELLGVASEQKK